MYKNPIIGVIIGLVIGVSGTVAANAMVNNKQPDANIASQQIASTDHRSMTMAEMNKQLATLSGDEFDKTFIAMMTIHHQGAIEMANLADTRAKHGEIKTLSQAIITAQNNEITEMQQWQMDWGYMSSESTMPGMNH